MEKILLQMDKRGRITIPAELRKKWNVSPGDFLAIDPEEKYIDKANIVTDEELKDPEVINALLKLGQKAREDYYNGKTKSLNEYVAESGNEDEF